MEISSAAPSSSTRKLNNPKAISKSSVLAEANPVKLEMGSTVVIAGESMVNTGVDSMMVGNAVSTSVDAVVSTMVGDAVSMSMLMANDAMSMSMPTADDAMSMSMPMVVDGAESTAVAGDESSILIDVSRSVKVGEGAGESVDQDPVVPTVGSN
jgi:hypothetical protein